ncbi:NACHT, LRR and PYD domains-containing protein [Desmophyllum pertusum]|uniref:NACHT, LRR and PYD domains-containing protein n=1 Tax=Desmophyllum pertusum TaxID=174260 RepID=A0A9X0DBR7_9CNID|nr:NACHT, LRR and PYD domains-containing protein [Desmophyllum pertusum]
MYVDLVIYTGRAEHAFGDLSKRHEIFDIYLKPQHGSIAIEKLDELFLPNEDTEDPRKILIVGRPGIGKSLLCEKMARDWSKGDLLRDSNKSFQHLFFVPIQMLLTTCRPNVEQSVAGLKFDRKVEIMGFTPEKVQEYVKKFCADPKTVNRIWGHISNNLELLSLCYIPVNSFIVCSLLEELIKLHEKERQVLYQQLQQKSMKEL